MHWRASFAGFGPPWMADAPMLVGIDVGTTAVKAAAYSTAGERLFSTACAYGVLPAEESGRVEQDPRAWMQAVEWAMRETRRQLPGHPCLAVGLTSQVNTHVFTDIDGHALLPAITWQDQRCADSSEILNAMVDDALRRSLPNPDFQVDASSLLSRAHWVKSHRPDAWEKTRYVFSPKDYCLFHLTGVAVADAISSIGLVGDDGEYLSPVVSLVDGLSDRLPPLRAITDVVGKIRDGSNPFGGCAVNVGVMDAWASLYGSGVARSGDAYEVAGTSEIIGVRSDRALPSSGVVTFPPIPGWYLHAGPTQLGGEAAVWLADFLRIETSRVFELAAAARNLQEPLLFLPHLMGERAPFWNARAKGVLAGLTRKHTVNDVAHAVLEGVGCAARALLERLEAAAGLAVDVIRLSGGGSRSDLWCQIKADMMNRPIQRLKNTDTGTFGAAILAGVGANVYPGIDRATEAAVQVDREFPPRRAQRTRCDFVFARYLETYHAMNETSRKLHDFANRGQSPAGESLAGNG